MVEQRNTEEARFMRLPLLDSLLTVGSREDFQVVALELLDQHPLRYGVVFLF